MTPPELNTQDRQGGLAHAVTPTVDINQVDTLSAESAGETK